MTEDQIKILVTQAAEQGATRALARIGLQDDAAVHDVRDLRDLLSSWRETRKSILMTAVKMITVCVLTFIAGAVFVKTGGLK